MEKIIPLNLIMDYPVSWSKYKVLRDFIQNFYDSVSHEKFETYFQYELTEDGVLLLRTASTGFNYEWLIHMGASTKREQPEKYAGHFGEGFKIAALWASKVIVSNVQAANKRKQALAWLKQQNNEYILVQDSFRDLGYQSLEDKCKEKEGFTDIREPRGIEKNNLRILENCVESIFKDFFQLNNFPEYKVIVNERASWQGFAKCIKRQEYIKNNEGCMIRYHIPTIAIKASLFQKEYFGEALSTYLHELCHMFGGDRSESFSLALSYSIKIVVENLEKIKQFQQEWTGDL